MASLRQAAASHNWPVVQHIDLQIAELLGVIRDKPLDAVECKALQELRVMHRQICEYCQEQSDLIASKMTLAMRNREGATAYAAFMDAEDVG